MRKGCSFHSTTVAALPYPILTMNTAPVAGSGNLASFVWDVGRRYKGQRKLRGVRIVGGDAGTRHAGKGCKHDLESLDEKCCRPLEKKRRGSRRVRWIRRDITRAAVFSGRNDGTLDSRDKEEQGKVRQRLEPRQFAICNLVRLRLFHGGLWTSVIRRSMKAGPPSR